MTTLLDNNTLNIFINTNHYDSNLDQNHSYEALIVPVDQIDPKKSLEIHKLEALSNAINALEAEQPEIDIWEQKLQWQFGVFLKDISSHINEAECSEIKEAFEFAKYAHREQRRSSGEPYIFHPLAVSTILAEWHMDKHTLMAALMHDVVEDTPVTSLELENKFGKTVATIVDGVSKLKHLAFKTAEEAQAENFRRMLMAVSNDARVILVKLADRLHNMRTLGAVKPHKQKRIARETLDIYAPIAHRLGLNTLYRELEDLCFKYLYPHRYSIIEKAIQLGSKKREVLINDIKTTIENRLRDFGINAVVVGRFKSLYSIYTKMLSISQYKNGRVKLSDVSDVYGFRIVVQDVTECYLALGALHTYYKPIIGQFKDYIALPKENGYQSLHTKLNGPTIPDTRQKTVLDIQLRTEEMNRVASAGIISYCVYGKGQGQEQGQIDLQALQQQTHGWVQSLLELKTDSGDSLEFLDHLKRDLTPNNIYVYTPKNDVLSLPKDATPVDFAYAIHSDLGNRCVACKINSELSPLRTKLKNGDYVEIIVSENTTPRPNSAWLHFVVTGKARAQIRHYLRSEQYEDSVRQGKRLINQHLRLLQADPELISEESWTQLVTELNHPSADEICFEVGVGKLLAIYVAKKLIGHNEDDSILELQTSDKPNHTDIIPERTSLAHHKKMVIHGTEGIGIQFEPCCCPIPGDSIVGVIRPQGLMIHQKECTEIQHVFNDPEKWVDVEWADLIHRTFKVPIDVLVRHDQGALATISSAISSCESNILGIRMDDSNDNSSSAHILFILQVRNRVHLARIMRVLRRLPEVLRVQRLINNIGKIEEK